MKNYIFNIVIITLFLGGKAFCQNSNNSTSIFVKTFFGVGEIELENNYITNANFSGGSVGAEFDATKLFSILIELEHLVSTSDYFDLNDEHTHLTNSYLQLPIGVGIGYGLSDNTSVYSRVSFLFSYLYMSKMENLKLGLDNSINNLGVNFGVIAAAGLKQKLDEHFDFNLGLRTQTDSFSISNGNSSNSTSINELYAFEIGVSYKF